MITSLASYDLRWADRPLERKDHASGKLFDQPLPPKADPSASPVTQTSISDTPRPDSGVSTAIWSSVIREPASREVEPRGVSYKDDGLFMILSNDDGTQNSISTVNPKDSADGSQIVYVETDDRGKRRGYEVDVSKVDLSRCSRIEALAVASFIKDEIAARSDGTTSKGVSYQKGLIGDFYDMASDGGSMFASKSDMVWGETVDFIRIAERHLAHWSEPLEGAPKPKIADGDAIAQCIQIADELSRIMDAQEKLPPEKRNISYDGWDEVDVTKLGAPEATVSSEMSGRTLSASGQKLDLSSFIQRAEQLADDVWQDLFDPKDDDEKRS